LGALDGHERMLKEEVDEEDIAKVVSRWTGIPVAKMLQTEAQKLLTWRTGCASAWWARRRPSRRFPTPSGGTGGLQDENRPLGSFLFLGPTGVGKTELRGPWPSSSSTTSGRWSAWTCRSSWRSIPWPGSSGRPRGTSGTTRGVSHRSGAPPALTPVILFDEMEKAHADVFNILLQVLDEGRLTDGQAGRWTSRTRW